MSAKSPVRRTAVFLGVVAVVGVAGFTASRSAWFRGLIARDQINPGEVDRLKRSTLLGSTSAPASADWPQWLGPTRNAHAPAGPLRTDWEATPPHPLWTAPCGAGYSSFAVVNNRLYTQDKKAGKERVLCLCAETGKEHWRYEYAAGQAGADATYGAGPRATPLIDGTRVYTVGGAGKFLCLEAPTAPGGKPVVAWQHDLIEEFGAKMPQWGVACSPVLDGDQVIVQPGGPKGTVAAFDKATGNRRWAFGSNPSGYSSPVVTTQHGVRVVLALTGDSLLCLRNDGVLMGSYSWKTDNKGNIATPLVVDDYVFISSGYNMGCAMLRVVPGGENVSLELVYAKRGKPLRAHHSTPVFKDGYVYGFDDINGRMKCFDLRTGDANEAWDADGVDKGTMILAGRHLIVLTQRGDLLLVEARPDEFSFVAKVPKVLNGRNTWALPVLVNGRLYLRDDEKIVCLDVR